LRFIAKRVCEVTGESNAEQNSHWLFFGIFANHMPRCDGSIRHRSELRMKEVH
jgi:hypothetical protein